MELPTELWNLIAYDLKFELDLYKNGMLVNKQLYNVIKQLYERIPNQLHVKTFADETSLLYHIITKIIKSEFAQVHKNKLIEPAIEIGDAFIINRNNLLKHDKCIFHYYDRRYGIFQINPQNYLDDKLNQICHNIDVISNTNGFYLCYHNKK